MTEEVAGETKPTMPPVPQNQSQLFKYFLFAFAGLLLLSAGAAGGYWYGVKNEKLKMKNEKLQLKTQNLTPTSSPLLTPTPSQPTEEIASLLCTRTGDPGAHLEEWSDDKEYVTCESGSAAAVRSLRIISLKDNSITDFFAYKRDAYGWSPTGHYLGYSRLETVDLSRHPVEFLNEGSGSSSLILYDAAQRNFKVLFEGNSDNGYLFIGWETPDKLVYKQFDPQNPDLYIPGGTPSRCFNYDLTTRQSHSVKCD